MSFYEALNTVTSLNGRQCHRGKEILTWCQIRKFKFLNAKYERLICFSVKYIILSTLYHWKLMVVWVHCKLLSFGAYTVVLTEIVPLDINEGQGQIPIPSYLQDKNTRNSESLRAMNLKKIPWLILMSYFWSFCRRRKTIGTQSKISNRYAKQDCVSGASTPA